MAQEVVALFDAAYWAGIHAGQRLPADAPMNPYTDEDDQRRFNAGLNEMRSRLTGRDQSTAGTDSWEAVSGL